MANNSINSIFGNSSLFNSSNTWGSTSTGTTNNLLGDMASIRNGSYKKLLKAYYKETAKSENSESSTGNSGSELTKTEKTQVSTIASSMSELKNAADALKTKSKNNLFVKGEDGYDYDKLYEAAKRLTDAYNSAKDAVSAVSITAIDKKSAYTENLIKKNSNLLKKAGIKMDADGKLSINETDFKNADINTLKSLFNGSNSIADRISKHSGDVVAITDVLLKKTGSTYNRSALLNGSSGSGSSFDLKL